jgi:hypothetical protein
LEDRGFGRRHLWLEHLGFSSRILNYGLRSAALSRLLTSAEAELLPAGLPQQ